MLRMCVCMCMCVWVYVYHAHEEVEGVIGSSKAAPRCLSVAKAPRDRYTCVSPNRMDSGAKLMSSAASYGSE